MVRATIFWMPTDHILALLIAERDKLDRAIEALSSLTKRRGRGAKSKAGAKPARRKKVAKPDDAGG